MNVLAEFRESKLFKLVSDISVFHWFLTVIPGLIAAVAAALHGKSIETVVLFFAGVCALAFIAVHYGGLIWAKYGKSNRKGNRREVAGKSPAFAYTSSSISRRRRFPCVA